MYGVCDFSGGDAEDNDDHYYYYCCAVFPAGRHQHQDNSPTACRPSSSISRPTLPNDIIKGSMQEKDRTIINTNASVESPKCISKY